MTVGEVLNIEKKKDALTLEELGTVMAEGVNNPIIQAIPAVATVMGLVGTVLQLYGVVLQVKQTIEAAKPIINKATKVGACVMNPTMVGEMAQDVLVDVQKELEKQAKEGIQTAKDAVFNLEIPTPV
jgi:hypothetical protein